MSGVNDGRGALRVELGPRMHGATREVGVLVPNARGAGGRGPRRRGQKRCAEKPAAAAPRSTRRSIPLGIQFPRRMQFVPVWLVVVRAFDWPSVALITEVAWPPRGGIP